MPVLLDDLPGPTRGAHRGVVEPHRLITLSCQLQIVRDQHERRVQFEQKLAGPVCVAQVQQRGRFVGDNQPGLRRQHRGDGQQLPLPAGQIGYWNVSALGQTVSTKNLRHHLRLLRARDARQRQRDILCAGMGMRICACGFVNRKPT